MSVLQIQLKASSLLSNSEMKITRYAMNFAINRVNEFQTGTLAILLASVLWGTTGTAGGFAPDLSPLAIGAFSMGVGALLRGFSVSKDPIRTRQAFAEQEIASGECTGFGGLSFGFLFIYEVIWCCDWYSCFDCYRAFLFLHC